MIDLRNEQDGDHPLPVLRRRVWNQVTVNDAGTDVLSIAPDRENPFSWRDFCKKGKTAGETRNHPRRLTSPMRRVGDRYVPATYDEALTDIAARFNAIIDRYGPDAIGSYHGKPTGMAFHDTVFYGGLLRPSATEFVDAGSASDPPV